MQATTQQPTTTSPAAAERDVPVQEKRTAASGHSGTHEGRYFEPLVDIYETADALTVRADLPGARPEDIDTDLQNNVLTVTARVPPVASGFRPVAEEYAVGHYSRQFRLGQQIDQTRISAELKDGVLTLTLPKADNARPRRIEVKQR